MPSPAALLASPYEPEARYSTKREVEWIGSKVHFTETCEPETPHVIVNVETTPATTPDDPDSRWVGTRGPYRIRVRTGHKQR